MIDIFKNGTSGARWDIETKKRFRPFYRKKFLEPYGFKVYSQNDEDGIISEIFSRIGTTDKRFIEFGVENGLECNTHYLLLKGWSGLWLEGSEESCADIENKFRPAINSGQLKLANAFITRENINDIFIKHGFTGCIDLLSIDIDGNDYHIWNAIDAVDPRVVIIEYNAKIPPECSWYMPYNEYHAWDGSDRQGASLKALELLGREKGYQLIGTNLNGINAFFVKDSLAGRKFPLPATSENLYNPMRFNYLTYRSGHPANVFLGYKTEGIAGNFQYSPPNQTYIFGFGFWPPEYNLDTTFLIQWMNAKNATLFVKAPRDTTEIIIAYKSLAPCRVHFCIEEQVVALDVGAEERTTSLKISASEEEKIYPIKITVNDLVVPQRVLSNGDCRKVGIGITSISCCSSTKN